MEDLMSSSLTQIENQIPGLDKVGGGVNTKTAAYADWSSITSLLSLPESPDSWDEVQVLSKTYMYPKGFRVSVGNTSATMSVVGSGRDTYIRNIKANLDVGGSYGGFSGTFSTSFDMSEDTTEGYSFGTRTFQQQLYSLTLPTEPELDALLDPQFKDDLNNLDPAEFYTTYGTHYTSSVLIGAKASFSVYSQFKKTFTEDTFKVDLEAGYKSVVADFKTTGNFSYDSQNSGENYSSTSSLVLVGGDTSKDSMKDWQSTIQEFPEFIDFNTQAASSGLVPMYHLLPAGSARRKELETALADYLNPPLHTLIFAAASIETEFPSAIVQVPDKYKILSGGAKVDLPGGGAGDLLTASYPISTNQWAAKAKDSTQPGTTILTAFALAVYDPYDWLDVRVYSQMSDKSQAPSASVGVSSVSSEYALTGGGAETIWDGPGSYLTASYPTMDNSGNPVWFAASQDHLEVCPAVMKTYAIGVAWSDKAPGKPSRIVAEISQNESNPDQHPSVTVGAPGGTVMVGGGAYDNCRSGTGNLIVQSYPSDAETWSASGTDHIYVSPGTLTVYAIGVSNMQIGS
jgi:hypothetical protein